MSQIALLRHGVILCLENYEPTIGPKFNQILIFSMYGIVNIYDPKFAKRHTVYCQN